MTRRKMMFIKVTRGAGIHTPQKGNPDRPRINASLAEHKAALIARMKAAAAKSTSASAAEQLDQEGVA